MMSDNILLDAQKEHLRASRITELGRIHGCRALADTAIFNGWPIDSFRKEISKTIFPSRLPITALGLSKNEIRDFSAFRALIRLGSSPKRSSGFEEECTV